MCVFAVGGFIIMEYAIPMDSSLYSYHFMKQTEKSLFSSEPVIGLAWLAFGAIPPHSLVN